MKPIAAIEAAFQRRTAMRTLTMKELAAVNGAGLMDGAMHATHGVLERERPLTVKESAKQAAETQQSGDGPWSPLPEIPSPPSSHPCGENRICRFVQ
jgi:hypothetical protein